MRRVHAWVWCRPRHPAINSQLAPARAGADWGLAQAVEEGAILGPRLLFTGHALSQTGGHGDMRGK